MVDLTFSYDELLTFLLIVVRVTCFIYLAPFFNMGNTPNRVKIGKNVAISGGTTIDDYPHGLLESGQNIIKVGDGR